MGGTFAPVGVAVFGVSTPFGHWGLNLVCRVVEAITGATFHMHITTMDELREGFSRRCGASVVVTSDFPDAKLAAYVCASELPLIAFSDDPGDTVDWNMRSRNLNALDAVRFSTRLFSAVALPFVTKRTLLVAAGRHQSPERIVMSIIEHLFPGRGAWLSEKTFEFLVESGKVAPDCAVDRTQYQTVDAATISEVERESLTEIRHSVDGYADLMSGQWPQQIVWPLELFYRKDDRSSRAAFDLTGPARVLFYGPYAHLPVGEWTVQVEFEIDDAISGVEATTDIYINEVVTEKTFTMPAKGIYAYELRFRVDDPHVAVQIRLFMKKSAIEGVFLPRSVKVRPQRREGD